MEWTEKSYINTNKQTFIKVTKNLKGYSEKAKKLKPKPISGHNGFMSL